MMKSLLVLAFGFSIATVANAESQKFRVDGMHCNDCVASVKQKVCAMGDFASCNARIVDPKKEIGEVSITTKGADKIDVAKLDKVIGDAGYKLNLPKATKKN